MHQQQPCNKSCVCTSIAMILGLPAAQVIADWHHKYQEEDASLRDILNGYGIEFRSFDTADRGGMNTAEEGYYLVTVPSLNFVGGNHQVAVELEGGLFSVYDPQAGKPGIKYYVGASDDPLAVPIVGGYTLEVLITKESLAKWKAKQ
jgi:hypothetical protein